MANRKSPLRDRLLSNSPDPIKSSILRESGMGWNTTSSAPGTGSISSTSSSSSVTPPLRIARGDSPKRIRSPAVARRSSSSYKHMHSNNLVSKSPFKSQIPAPSTPGSRPAAIAITFPTSTPTRRVSAEKRPRPNSLHEQGETENARPLSLKRDRKQSKAIEGLLQKEPVTKSPFRTGRTASIDRSKKSPPAVRPRSYPSYTPQSPTVDPPAAAVSTPSQIFPLARPESGPSPGRSALVSRRMHGPRLSGSGRRERRKTVTFDERCDVLEFDRDETDEEAVESFSEGEDGSFEGYEHDNIKIRDMEVEASDDMDQDEPDSSYESGSVLGEKKVDVLLALDPNTSITGLVDEMFFSSTGNGDASVASFTTTPPRHSSLPVDLEAEDGVPLGRSHHIDRFLQHQEQHLQSPRIQPPRFSPHTSPHQNSPRASGVYPFNFNLPTHVSLQGLPATPPRRSPGMTHSTPPLGRTTHLERIKQAREEEQAESEVDAVLLPPSPSHAVKSAHHDTSDDGLIPRFDLEHGSDSRDGSASLREDPFDQSMLQDQSVPTEVNASSVLRSAEVSNVSSDVNLSQLVKARSRNANEDIDEGFSSFLEKVNNQDSPSSRRSSFQPSPAPGTSGSPLFRGGSPLTLVSSPLVNGTQSPESLRPRISKEDVQRRLLGRRSFCDQPSPSNSPTAFSESRQSPGLAKNQMSPQGSLTPAQDDNRDRLSIMTVATDFSVETAVIEQAERANVTVGSLVSNEGREDSEFGHRPSHGSLKCDFGGRFSLGGLGISAPTDATSTDSPMTDLPPTTRPGFTERTEVRMGDKDVDMDMKSALDRLMEDVAGGPVDDSLMDDSFLSQDSLASTISISQEPVSRPKVLERATTDSALIQSNYTEGVTSRSVSGSSTSTLPPPVPPKDSIKHREQLILEKRRQARRMYDDDDEADESFEGPSLNTSQSRLGVGRPSRRRSMSTNDAQDIVARRRGQAMLEIGDMESDSLLGRIEKELNKPKEEPKKTSYQIRERQGTIYASSSTEKVSHHRGAGDIDAGRAWRTVRRPSDMNEYAKQIREYRAQEKGKAYGKVFVKVLAVKGVRLPLPRERTAITCTLNNGIHFVTTPECQLGETAAIEQEFELIEHSKLEFTLTVKVRRDPHILAQFKALEAPRASVPTPVPIPPPLVQTVSKSSGMFSMFSSSPRKSKEKHTSRPVSVAPPLPQQPTPHILPENLARYLKPDGTMARAFVSFKDIVHRCDTRLFETSYPLIGQRAELGGKFSTQQIGEIVLQMFRLPPLPGIPQDQLPQSLDECHRGLRHINWHKMTYFQGTLTQSGGDCSTWRRRQFRVIGGNLVSFNDVTKKATATIDLKKAIGLEDDQECNDSTRYETAMYGVERSFRLIFPLNEEIMFFADTDEEKHKWLEVFRALVGHIPPHPLWAELLWQRQEELTKRAQAARQVATPYDPSSSTAASQQQR